MLQFIGILTLAVATGYPVAIAGGSVRANPVPRPVVARERLATPIAPDVARQEKKIDINQASVARLQDVPGIGPALASRIVAWRDEHGPFERVDDLLNVRGIGVKTLEKLRPYLEVGATLEPHLG